MTASATVHRPAPVTAGLVVVVTAALVYTAHLTAGLGGPEHPHLWNHWVYDGITGVSSLLCLWRARVGDDRGAWGAIGVALVFFWMGDIYWNNALAGLAHPPYPSWSDACYLIYYAPLYVGMMLLIRARTGRLLAAIWLEGVVGALALSSVAATVVFDPVVASTHGNVAQVATNLAYPTLDVVLLALIAAGFALQGHRAGRQWVLLGVGLLLSGVADSVYLVQVAHGSYSESGWINAGWPLSTVVIAVAAWTRNAGGPRKTDPADGWATQILTGFFALLIVGVLALEAVRRIPIVAHVLLTLAVVAMLARLALAGRERRQLARRTIEARTDDLTGLANRRGLYEATDRALANDGRAGILLLDLNRFKELNDTLGHHMGDELLCQVAARMSSALAPNHLVARLGGDTFVALCDGSDEVTAVAAARLLQDALEPPFALDGFLVPMAACVGIGLAPDHATTGAEILRCADVAASQAKARQTGVEVYQATGDHNSRGRLLLATELRRALTTDELVLHYQPQVAIDDGHCVGAEALVRWQHPRLGFVAPLYFVPVAEREGLIRLLTLGVLDRSLRQQHEWREAGDDIRVAVNLSPANLMDSRLPSDIASLMERYDSPAHLLELEITETTLMRDPERAMDILARISELGVEFALDDYGTGYSSLAQLRRLPVRSLKIDKSFVMDMTENESDANIVRSTIQLGRSLNLRVVAEGVETIEHLHALREYGCHIAQGFYLSRPVPADQFKPWPGGAPRQRATRETH